MRTESRTKEEVQEKWYDLMAQVRIERKGNMEHKYTEKVNWCRNRTAIRGRTGILL